MQLLDRFLCWNSIVTPDSKGEHTVNSSIMIPLLIILLSIHGVIAMKGESISDVRLAEFVVSIWYFHEHRCSGSILDRTHILTVGNCVNDLSSSLLSIAAGIIESNSRNIQLVPVRSIHLHPDFRPVCHSNGVHWENDIALSRELNWEPTIAAVPLIGTEYDWEPCNQCVLFGWNDATIDGAKLLTLRWSHATVMENKICRDLNVYPSKNVKCLEPDFETTILEEGDYGAPVICRSSVVGLITGGGENADSPPVVVSIHPYVSFIADILHVYGINIPNGNFQHYVAIFYDDVHDCGGSIIDSIHILTAAHCVAKRERDSLVIIPGHSEFSIEKISSLQLSFVRRIQIHPDYLRIRTAGEKWMILMNDIAVLTLWTPLVWGATIRPIPLSGHLEFGKSCQVYRWSTKIKEGTLLKSMWSSASILNPDRCRKINPFLASNRFCTENFYSFPIATKGDSGSPIICDGFLAGILSSHTLSMRLNHGPYQAMFFTAILPYLEFINNAVAVKIP